MVDMAGNYGVYCTDMTRTYSIGRLSDEAYRLHELSLEIHRQVMQKAALGRRVPISTMRVCAW